MSQGTFEFTAGDAFELTRLNRALAKLARPALSEEWVAPAAAAELISLGVASAFATPRRKDLIERIWTRKRQLLRRVETIDGWGPYPPVA